MAISPLLNPDKPSISGDDALAVLGYIRKTPEGEAAYQLALWTAIYEGDVKLTVSRADDIQR